MAPAGRALAFATAIAVAATGAGPTFEPARAQEQVTAGLPIIRDTEIENLLRDYAAPILKVAGLAQQNVRVVILNDSHLQRLRHGRPPHLHQFRRAVRSQDPE